MNPSPAPPAPSSLDAADRVYVPFPIVALALAAAAVLAAYAGAWVERRRHRRNLAAVGLTLDDVEAEAAASVEAPPPASTWPYDADGPADLAARYPEVVAPAAVEPRPAPPWATVDDPVVAGQVVALDDVEATAALANELHAEATADMLDGVARRERDAA